MCEGRGADAERRVQSEKQEPHTVMWGKAKRPLETNGLVPPGRTWCAAQNWVAQVRSPRSRGYVIKGPDKKIQDLSLLRYPTDHQGLAKSPKISFGQIPSMLLDGRKTGEKNEVSCWVWGKVASQRAKTTTTSQGKNN